MSVPTPLPGSSKLRQIAGHATVQMAMFFRTHLGYAAPPPPSPRRDPAALVRS